MINENNILHTSAEKPTYRGTYTFRHKYCKFGSMLNLEINYTKLSSEKRITQKSYI